MINKNGKYAINIDHRDCYMRMTVTVLNEVIDDVDPQDVLDAMARQAALLNAKVTDSGCTKNPTFHRFWLHAQERNGRR